jgi:hypothetical protein
MMKSVNGGATWTSIAGVTIVSDFAFGASGPGQTVPSTFVYATIGGVRGLYRSDDMFATTPKFLTQFPFNICDDIQCIGASPNKYGRVYVGFPGSGFVYADYDCPLTVS